MPVGAHSARCIAIYFLARLLKQNSFFGGTRFYALAVYFYCHWKNVYIFCCLQSFQIAWWLPDTLIYLWSYRYWLQNHIKLVIHGMKGHFHCMKSIRVLSLRQLVATVLMTVQELLPILPLRVASCNPWSQYTSMTDDQWSQLSMAVCIASNDSQCVQQRLPQVIAGCVDRHW